MTAFILSCPVCGKVPEWDPWDTCIPNADILWALYCINGCHQLRTSFWKKKSDVIKHWNKIVLDWR